MALRSRLNWEAGATGEQSRHGENTSRISAQKKPHNRGCRPAGLCSIRRAGAGGVHGPASAGSTGRAGPGRLGVHRHPGRPVLHPQADQDRRGARGEHDFRHGPVRGADRHRPQPACQPAAVPRPADRGRQLQQPAAGPGHVRCLGPGVPEAGTEIVWPRRERLVRRTAGGHKLHAEIGKRLRLPAPDHQQPDRGPDVHQPGRGGCRRLPRPLPRQHRRGAVHH